MRIILTLSALAALAGCGNECVYFEQCDGESTLLQCGAGVDQMFGRKVTSVPCDEDNPICVAEGDDHAACVSATTCDPSISAYCDGDKLVQCGEVYTVLGGTMEGPYETVADCTLLYDANATCVTTATGATCQAGADSGGS